MNITMSKHLIVQLASFFSSRTKYHKLWKYLRYTTQLVVSVTRLAHQKPSMPVPGDEVAYRLPMLRLAYSIQANSNKRINHGNFPSWYSIWWRCRSVWRTKILNINNALLVPSYIKEERKTLTVSRLNTMQALLAPSMVPNQLVPTNLG